MADQPIRVLLVEDSPTDAAIVLDTLEHGDKRGQAYSVKHVKRLEDAVTALVSNDFDVVMLDLDLPDSMGLDTLSGLLPASSNVPIVICSGLDNEETAIDALRHGAQEYLVKGRATGWATRRAIRLAIERKHMSDQPRY